MKKLILFALLAVSCRKNADSPQLLRQFSIHSVANSATYEIKIQLPESYDPAHFTYPVIYVLDGEENLVFVSSEAKRLAKKYGKEEVMVVSIGYGKDRAEDYTPTRAQGKGGAGLFMKFIREELIPRIEQEVAADTSRSSRIILGHSYGGLCAAYAFTQHNAVFGNYLMLSPSLWYDNEIVLDYEKSARPTLKDKRQLVFLGLGELENSGRMLAPFEAFYQVLRNNYKGTLLSKSLAEGLNHSGSKNPNISRGLEFYFQNK